MTGPTGGEALGDPMWDQAGELAFLPGTFALTELGNAERMVAQHRADIRYCDERKKWLVWNGHQWQWDKRRAVMRKAKATVRAIGREAEATESDSKRAELRKWATKSEKASSISAMVELAKSERGIAVEVGDLDLDPWLLNCANGTLDLRTRQLRPHSRDDLITRSTGVNYNPDAQSVLWLRVLVNGTGGDEEMASYLQRVSGYSLVGVATEKKFFFLFGPPDSGKSTLILGLHACMGSYARSTDFDTWLARPQIGGNRNDLVALQGARLVTSVEVSKKARWDTATLKRFTGGDTITAMAKFEDEISYVASCTIIMAANDSPKARDDDPGLWRRIQRVPFPNALPVEAQIKGLGETLREPEHAEAILAWAVEGCRLWQAQGVGTSSAVETSTEEYKTENDWLAGFIDMFELDTHATIKASNFRSLYKTYCEQEGQFTETTKELAKQMEERLPGVRYTKYAGERIWKGLKLKSGQVEPEEGRWS